MRGDYNMTGIDYSEMSNMNISSVENSFIYFTYSNSGNFGFELYYGKELDMHIKTFYMDIIPEVGYWIEHPCFIVCDIIKIKIKNIDDIKIDEIIIDNLTSQPIHAYNKIGKKDYYEIYPYLNWSYYEVFHNDIANIEKVRGKGFYKSCKNVVDLGSNLGFMGKYISQFTTMNNYICIEPNTKLNKCNKLINKNSTKNIVIYDKVFYSNDNIKLNFYEINGINSPLSSLDFKTVANKVIKSTITLEKIIDDNNLEVVDFLKVDIEGAEIYLANSKNLNILKDRVKHISIETHSNDINKDLVKILSDNNFEILSNSDNHIQAYNILFEDKKEECQLKVLYNDDLWSTIVSPDQQSINKYLESIKDLFIGKKALHIGIGTSTIFTKFNDIFSRIDGITVMDSEIDVAKQYIIPHQRGKSEYVVHKFNKYNIKNFDFLDSDYSVIIDNNLKHYGCCNHHWEEFYKCIIGKLKRGGILLTHTQGFVSHTNKVTSLSIKELEKLSSNDYSIMAMENFVNSEGYFPIVVKRKDQLIDGKNLMVVAHPDDEIIFGYTQLMNKLADWTVLCVTNGDNKERSREFKNIMKKIGVKYEIWDYLDVWDNKSFWDIEQLSIRIKKFLELGFDNILTHNKDGDYGHTQHKILFEIISEIVTDENLFCFDISNISLDSKVLKNKLDTLSLYKTQFKRDSLLPLKSIFKEGYRLQRTEKHTEKKLLIVSPHLSTGGSCQYLLKYIETFSKDYSEITVVEFTNFALDFDVQRNKIRDFVGSENLITLGDYGEWDIKGEEYFINKRLKLLNIVEEFNPDIVWMNEFPECYEYKLPPDEVMKQLYDSDRNYKIIETTHNNAFDFSDKKYIPDEFLFCDKMNFEKSNNIDIPKTIWEYPIELNERPNRERTLKKLELDPDYLHILNVGLLNENKNQKYIFDLADKFRNDKIMFHFIGNHCYIDNCGITKDQLNNPNCKVWGERSDVDNFYSCMDLFLFPSKRELNPITIKEALSWNMTVIANKDEYTDNYNDYSNFHLLDDVNIEDFLRNMLFNKVEKVKNELFYNIEEQRLWNNLDIEGSDLSARLGHTYTLLSLNYSLE